MSSFHKNNLENASSPYLQQHKENPIHWQEWNEETLKHAKEQNKLILVSIGYATCHWCHVMAKEAFSDQKVADFLNEEFVSIKVDREQRPDLDEYFMAFAQETIGHGGWPLNVVLTPQGKPFFAGTYFPVKPKQGIPGFLSAMKKVKKWAGEHKDEVTLFSFKQNTQEFVEEKKLFDLLKRGFDDQYGGFGFETKFPPTSTILFLLSWYEETKDAHLIPMITKTLNEMMNNGLHDHLQGGFFRYAVDRQWQIPHFEKMLYDQAMHLWVYSWAYHILGIEEYKTITKKLIQCLQQSFANEQGLFYSALDADTNHQEGETYLWEYAELQSLLNEEELKLFWEEYLVSKKGNFFGKNHLIKSGNSTNTKSHQEQLATIEDKLLAYRKKREQPFVDKKVITSWNALLGVGLVQAARFCDLPEAKEMAETILSELEQKHSTENGFSHSSLEGKRQSAEFLEDIASVLLLYTYLYENNPKDKTKRALEKLVQRIKTYNKEDGWVTNPRLDDFTTIFASQYDHPIPSSVSLAEFALYRAEKLLGTDGKDTNILDYLFPTQYDFANLLTFFKKGNLHELHSLKKIPFNQLLVNSIQVEAKSYQDCYKFQCRAYKSEEDLIQALKK